MSKKKVLIVTQEMEPYTVASEIAAMARKLPQHIQENGLEIRVLMPRFGSINERRHRLHEVVRLSGMNIIVDDDDYPLIIKVASLQEARMQVYFLDNDDFFRRKSIFVDDSGVPFDDNADRAVFFCKGVIETVKKFGWPPDVVHCLGPMTSLIPFYLKSAYKSDPLFLNTKVVYSVYNEALEDSFSLETFLAKAGINNISAEELAGYQTDGAVSLHKGAIAFADGVVKGSHSYNEDIQAILAQTDKPVINGQSPEDLPEIMEFYQTLMGQIVAE
jgi:starch synthase